jgi:hypothetical protein
MTAYCSYPVYSESLLAAILEEIETFGMTGILQQWLIVSRDEFEQCKDHRAINVRIGLLTAIKQ